MAIGFGSIGTIPVTTGTGTGTTSVTPGLPTGLVDGNLCVIWVYNKYDGASPTTPASWTLAGTFAGGGGSAGNDSGPLRITAFYRVKDATWSTMPTITVTGGNSSMAVAVRYTNATGLWDVVAVGGADTTSDVNFQANYTTQFADLTTSDMMIGSLINPTDGVTYSSPILFSGVAGPTTTLRGTPKTSAGTDMGGIIVDRLNNANGSGSGGYLAATLSGASTGVALSLRLREAAAPTPIAASESTALTVTESAQITKIFASTDEGAISVSDTGSVATVATLRNPSFETDTSVWLTSGGNLTRTTSDAQDGIASGRMTSTATANLNLFSPLTSDFAAAPGQNWSESLFVKWENGTPRQVRLDVLYRDGSSDLQTFLGTATTVGTGAWTELKNEGSLAPANTQFVRLRLVGLSATSGDTYLVDNITLEPVASLPGDETPISGSDSASISVAESSELTKNIFVTDTNAISVSESVSLNSTLSRADTTALSVAESASTFVTLNATDSAALSVTDSSAILASVAIGASDSAALSVSESRAIASSLSRTDAAALSVSESALIFSSLDRTDDLTISLTESVANTVTQSASDSAALSVSESVEFNKTLSAEDAVALSVSESSVAVKAISATDDITLSVTESHGFAANMPGTDGSALGVTESTSILVTTSASDSAALAISESGTTVVTLSRADSAALSVTEARTVALPVTANDTLTIGVNEVGIDAVIAEEITSDSTSISVSETSSIAITLSRTDSLVIGLAETREIASTAGQVDGGSIALTESTSILVTIQSSDDIGLSISEVGSTGQEITASDTISMGVIEASDAFQQETDVVQAMVYLNGAWRTGTLVEFRRGAWHARTIRAYRNGQWNDS